MAGVVFAPHSAAQVPAGAAARDDRLLLRLGYGLAWDDNVFRLPDDAPDPEASRGISGKSDRFTTASIGVHLNVPYALQRFLVDVTRSAVRYEKFSSRDQDPFTYLGSWQWALTPRLTGVLTVSRSETPVEVEDVEGRRSIDQLVTTRSGSVDLWVSGGWHALGSVRSTDTAFSEPFLARPDTSQRIAELGLRYIARSNSQLTLTRRSARGTETVTDPTAFGGSDFTQDDTELSAIWIVTGRSTLTGRATRIQRQNEVFPQRDFSASTGDLRHNWRPTGRLTIETSATRNVEPFNISVESTTRVDDTIAASVGWALTEHTSVVSLVSRRVSRYGQVSTSLEARRDTTDSFELGARWVPRRYVSVQPRVRHEKRDSTDARQVFDNNTVSVNVELVF